MNYLGLTLLWCAIQVTIFAAVAAALYLTMRRRSPAARSTVLAASLISVILLTGLAWSPWPRWVPDSSETSARRSSSSNKLGLEGEPVVAETFTTKPSAFSEAGDSTTLLFLENLWYEMKQAPAPAEITSAAWNWQAIVACLFLGVFALGLLRLTSGILAVRRYRSRSEPLASVEMNVLLEGLQLQLDCRRKIELRVSSEVSSPATIGWRRPIILLPPEWKDWNQSERVAVIAHEVAHIKRFDFPAWFAAQMGVVLHFYHPLVHWLAGRLRLEQELAADAAAAEVLGGNSNYLTTLAGMALRRDDRSLSWAARTFLPTRHTFIRRIEMLRRGKVLDIHFSSVGRALLAGVILAAAIFAAGWRSPFEEIALAQQPDATTNSSEITATQPVNLQDKGVNESGPLSLSYVPRDSMLVMAARPAVLLAQPIFLPIKKALDEQDGLQELFGVDVRSISQVTAVGLSGERPGMPDDPALILHFNQELDQKTFLTKMLNAWEEKDLGGVKYYQSPRQRSCAFPDDRTAIYASKPGDVIRILAAGEKGAEKANWIDTWKSVEKNQGAVMIDLERMREGIDQELSGGMRNPVLNFHPIWRQGKRLVWGIDTTKNVKLQMLLQCESGQAQLVADTIKSGIVLARNGLSSYRAEVARRGGEHALMEIKTADLADEVLDQTKLEVNDDLISGQVALGEEASDIIGFLIPAITQARVAAKRTQSMNNLKQIGLAMHNYYDTNKHLPPAVVMGPDGKTPHSWRIEILPYIDQSQLYNEYHMNEPWDSEHNKKLLEKIPDIFRCPADDASSTNTSYFVLAGEGTMFGGTEGTSFARVTDGLSNTLMVVESKKSVPWTKPEDIPIDFEKELPKFGGWYPGGFQVVMGDGAAKFISESIDKQVLKALITSNGGEPIPRN